MNTRSTEQELRLEGRRLLSRHYYGDGRWGMRARDAYQRSAWRDWRIVKHRPKAITWALGSALRSRKVHAIRYVLTAEHPSGMRVWMVVWLCGQYAHSEPIAQSHPRVVCTGCHVRLTGATLTAVA